MNLADQAWPYSWPVGLQVVTQIVPMCTHVKCNGVIHLSRRRIPKWFWIPIFADWTIGGLPDSQLSTGSQLAAENGLDVRQLAVRHPRLAIRGTLKIMGRGYPFLCGLEEILLFINVYDPHAPEVHWIGVKRPSAPEEVRVEDLQRQGFPASCGASAQHPRICLANNAEVSFHFRNYFP